LELSRRRHLARPLLAETKRALEELPLDLIESRADRRHEVASWNRLTILHGLVTAADKDGSRGDIARADLDANGNASLHPMPDLLAAADVAVVDLDLDLDSVATETLLPELPGKRATVLEDGRALLIRAIDRQENDVLRREPRGKHETVVIGVRHDEPA